MMMAASIGEWLLGFILILSSLGIITATKPLYSSLSFLLTLVALAALYLQLSAQFISAMQILVYAGAILVIFVFVIVLFQDAHQQLARFKPKSRLLLLYSAISLFLLNLLFLGNRLMNIQTSQETLSKDHGTVESLGRALYLDFFFPFEAVILLFLVALVGALYIAKREKSI